LSFADPDGTPEVGMLRVENEIPFGPDDDRRNAQHDAAPLLRPSRSETYRSIGNRRIPTRDGLDVHRLDDAFVELRPDGNQVGRGIVEIDESP
jgi:hypothetical protein